MRRAPIKPSLSMFCCPHRTELLTSFNSTMTLLQGKALVKDVTQDLICEVEGNPKFIMC
ncbi:hypothetical protein VP01_2725g4 [Puccinia sorghi]|uniref:Uncharacterized protein n=1 Tax=Puccinia sorghi TaxID=27349 RepID=A0A0L6V3A9_9BASI|nr:hypothetical protein VP01_2725g4 [Puccinia sorghi]